MKVTTELFYPGATLNGDTSNWWGPNAAAVTAMLQEAGFRRFETFAWAPSRLAVHAFK